MLPDTVNPTDRETQSPCTQTTKALEILMSEKTHRKQRGERIVHFSHVMTLRVRLRNKILVNNRKEIQLMYPL